MTATILFYETNKPYGCFSNFSRHQVQLGGRTWPTSEHCFQAAKFLASEDVEAIFQAKTPFVAAQAGREQGRSLRPDWDSVKDRVMREVLEAKFAQHPVLAEILGSTQGVKLVEHTANDRYWADGGDGSGLNRLGVLLEEVRETCGGGVGRPPLVLPPWVAHPDIEQSDMFWRRGLGEDHMAKFEAYVGAIPEAAGMEYEVYFPRPASWI